MGFPTSVPTDDLTWLADIISGVQKFDRLRAITAAYDIAGYILGKFLGGFTTASVVKAKKVSKKNLAIALRALANPAEGEVAVKDFPFWLLPILLNLAEKWLGKA